MKETYIVDEKFINPDFDFEEIQVWSTPSDRTIQSAKAQMLGMFDLDSGYILSERQQNNAVPPMHISDIKQIKNELGNQAVANQYRPVPVFSPPKN